MIFVTVGAQMPFDRLVSWVDAWAGEAGRTDVCAQIGPTELRPRHLEVLPFMDPQAFRRQVERADAVVAHAGMGTILTVLELGKPLVVVPRLGERGETRNDHQVATARRFEEEKLVAAAYDREQLVTRLETIESTPPGARIGASASEPLLARLRAFVEGARP